MQDLLNGNVNCTSVTENKRIFYNLVITQILINDQDKFKPNTAVVRIVNIVYDSSR